MAVELSFDCLDFFWGFLRKGKVEVFPYRFPPITYYPINDKKNKIGYAVENGKRQFRNKPQ